MQALQPIKHNVNVKEKKSKRLACVLQVAQAKPIDVL